MRRLRIGLASLLKWRRKSPRTERDAGDSKEIDRLNAEYTGSFARNAGQELGILPPRYGRK